MKKALFIVFFLMLSGITNGQSTTINYYDTHINIHTNATLLVTETINITTDNQQVKHGIYRDLPTRYETKQGYHFDIGFKLIKVSRDGLPEPFHIKKMSNGVRIYIGDPNLLLPQGTYTYQISYSINRALGFFENHDELYWNVTGNAWIFPILKASAQVELPQQAQVIRATAYTGITGAREKDFNINYPATNEVTISTHTPLSPYQGLTIVVGWPKGIINQPDLNQEISSFVSDNFSLVFALGGYVFLILFYFLSWFYLGRDPKPQTIIPLFEPPKGFSPQALRYIKKMRYDNKMFTSAIINMAVKKFLTIEEKTRTEYILRKVSSDDSLLTPPEQAISNALFQYSPKVVLVPDNHEKISEAIRQFKRALAKEFHKKYFILNTPIICFSILVSIISLLPLALEKIDLFIPMTFVGIIVFVIVISLIQQFSSFRFESLSLGIIIAVMSFITFIIISFSPFSYDILFTSEWLTYLAVGLFLVTNFVFIYLLKRPTPLGTQIISQTKGFEMFLKATEQDRLNFRNPPDKTPQLFERYLPYAFALGLEQAWSAQFEKILLQTNYQPTWYIGNNYSSLSTSSFANSIGSSLNSAIVSSSTAPGSSSGFGGGGSSGGGGGGGGGGGW